MKRSVGRFFTAFDTRSQLEIGFETSHWGWLRLVSGFSSKKDGLSSKIKPTSSSNGATQMQKEPR